MCASGEHCDSTRPGRRSKLGCFDLQWILPVNEAKNCPQNLSMSKILSLAQLALSALFSSTRSFFSSLLYFCLSIDSAGFSAINVPYNTGGVATSIIIEFRHIAASNVGSLSPRSLSPFSLRPRLSPTSFLLPRSACSACSVVNIRLFVRRTAFARRPGPVLSSNALRLRKLSF